MNTSRRPDLAHRSTWMSRLLVIALTAAMLPAATAAAQPGISQDVPPATTPVNLGATDPGSRVEFNLVLAERDPGASKAYLAALADPSSPDYRRFLTAAESGARFGPTDATISRITADVHAAGLDVVSMPAQRTRLVVGGDAGTVGRFLGLVIDTYQDPRTGLEYHAAATDPAVPATLTDVVTGVTGLARYLPVSGIDPADAPPPPARGLKPADLAAAYGFQSLWDQGIDGTGTSIAILQFGVDTDEDLAVFDATFGLTGPLPERIPVSGGLVDAPADFGTEATLDTQVVRAVAPGAQILVYGFPLTTTFGAAMDAIVQDGRAQVVSVSYGKCFAGGYMSLAEYEEATQSLAAAAAAGVSLFAASGDWGAFSCHAFDKTDHQISTFYPACTDNVVSVGGTFLEVRPDGSYLRETGWEDYLTTGGTGGGFSLVDPVPTWQEGVPGIEETLTARAAVGDVDEQWRGRRACPDISAAADSDTGYLLFHTDLETGVADWKMVGGTSASAPMWAAAMALVQQRSQAAGNRCLGFVTPTLYQLSASHPEVFHDVTRGGNLVDVAHPGWDAATGLGSPDVALLADAWIATVPPSDSCAGAD